jgi:hypothetical protein
LSISLSCWVKFWPIYFEDPLLNAIYQ